MSLNGGTTGCKSAQQLMHISIILLFWELTAEAEAVFCGCQNS